MVALHHDALRHAVPHPAARHAPGQRARVLADIFNPDVLEGDPAHLRPAEALPDQPSVIGIAARAAGNREILHREVAYHRAVRRPEQGGILIQFEALQRFAVPVKGSAEYSRAADCLLRVFRIPSLSRFRKHDRLIQPEKFRVLISEGVAPVGVCDMFRERCQNLAVFHIEFRSQIGKSLHRITRAETRAVRL